jgi:hypothetical protein
MLVCLGGVRSNVQQRLRKYILFINKKEHHASLYVLMVSTAWACRG